MQAIQTKYLGPTDKRNARIVARAPAKRITVPWDHDLSPEDNHRNAARVLASKLQWFGNWSSGVLADGSSVHTCTRIASLMPDHTLSFGVFHHWPVLPPA